MVPRSSTHISPRDTQADKQKQRICGQSGTQTKGGTERPTMQSIKGQIRTAKPKDRIGLPHKGVRKRGCKSLILRLFEFVCVCSRLCAFICVLGPFSESLKFAFICVCAHLFAFVCVCEHPLLLHPPFCGTLTKDRTTKNFLNNSKEPPNKTRVLRQSAPESSPESSAICFTSSFGYLFCPCQASRCARWLMSQASLASSREAFLFLHQGKRLQAVPMPRG